MRLDVTLDDLGHESVDGAAAGGDHLQDVVAVVFLGQTPMYRFDLPSNAADPVEKPCLILGRVCDGGGPLSSDFIIISY